MQHIGRLRADLIVVQWGRSKVQQYATFHCHVTQTGKKWTFVVERGKGKHQVEWCSLNKNYICLRCAVRNGK